MAKVTTEERFWAKVEKGQGCWTWVAAMTTNGYGMFSFNGKSTTAHRVSYQLHFGPIPQGWQVDHRCFTPACVRPDHLEAVPQPVNAGRRQGASKCNRGSGVWGVQAHASGWRSVVKRGSVHHQFGMFQTIEEAHAAVLVGRAILDAGDPCICKVCARIT